MDHRVKVKYGKLGMKILFMNIPWVIDDKQLLREATDLISMGQEVGVRFWSGQVVTQKIDIKLVIIAEVIIEI